MRSPFWHTSAMKWNSPCHLVRHTGTPSTWRSSGSWARLERGAPVLGAARVLRLAHEAVPEQDPAHQGRYCRRQRDLRLHRVVPADQGLYGCRFLPSHFPTGEATWELEVAGAWSVPNTEGRRIHLGRAQEKIDWKAQRKGKFLIKKKRILKNIR